MPFPMTPAQAAILGKTRPAPSATVNAAGAVPSARPPTGQTPVPVATPAAASLGFTPNSMDEFLLGRANRQEPIRGGIGLLGRLAALGVGSKIQRTNREGQQEAIEAEISKLPPEMRSAARIAAIGGDPKAILPIIQQQASIAAQAEAREDSQSFTAGENEKNRTARAEESAVNRELKQQQLDQTKEFQSASIAIQEANVAINQRRLELAAIEDSQPDHTEANKLRSDWRTDTKTFKEQGEAYRRIKASAEDPTPAGDLALIFNFMKVLDPQSTVRESEFAQVGKAGSLPTQIQRLYDQAATGQALTVSQRADILNRSDKLFAEGVKGYEQLEKTYQNLAKRRDVDVEDFMIDYAGDLRNVGQSSDGNIDNMSLEEVEAEAARIRAQLQNGS